MQSGASMFNTMLSQVTGGLVGVQSDFMTVVSAGIVLMLIGAGAGLIFDVLGDRFGQGGSFLSRDDVKPAESRGEQRAVLDSMGEEDYADLIATKHEAERWGKDSPIGDIYRSRYRSKIGEISRGDD